MMCEAPAGTRHQGRLERAHVWVVAQAASGWQAVASRAARAWGTCAQPTGLAEAAPTVRRVSQFGLPLRLRRSQHKLGEDDHSANAMAHCWLRLQGSCLLRRRGGL